MPEIRTVKLRIYVPSLAEPTDSFFFFSSRRRHTRWTGDWSSDVVLFRSVSAWAAEQRVDEIDTYVEDDDEESLALALRRGFHELARESGLELDVRDARVDTRRPPGVAVDRKSVV